MTSINNRVYSEIKRRIVLLDYKPGQVLREKELEEEFGISRTPIREALIRLEGEGLIRIFPNRGIYVTEVSFQDLRDVFEVRSLLIGLAGRLAAERVTDKELDKMKSLLQKIKSVRDSRTLRQLDLSFHDLINRATHNSMLVDILERLRNQVGRIWVFTSDNDDYLLRIAGEFEELIKALEKRDKNKCEKILRDHVIRFVEHISRFVNSAARPNQAEDVETQLVD